VATGPPIDQGAGGSAVARSANAPSRPDAPHSVRVGSSPAQAPGAAGFMRITYRIFLVGGIPITIAAAIALAALVNKN
jgi:hypothetical protein